jgi:NAD(P)-dependent dehydrogenase (short-subunit alcohol dehydrogenase family)
MTSSNQTAPTALITGASRGFGRAITAALHAEGFDVVAVARDADRLHALRDELGDRTTVAVADVTDPVVAGTLIERYRPNALVLNAGAAPLLRPLHQHTWETFSTNWNVDVRHAFQWLREALLLPLEPGSTVVAMSSGAALAGSPLSGGYAGAKASIRFVTGYAADESRRAGLGIRFVSLLPKLTAATDLGSMAAGAYARRSELDLDAYLEQLGAGPSVEQVGKATVELVDSRDDPSGAYVLTAAGLAPVG